MIIKFDYGPYSHRVSLNLVQRYSVGFVAPIKAKYKLIEAIQDKPGLFLDHLHFKMTNTISNERIHLSIIARHESKVSQ